MGNQNGNLGENDTIQYVEIQRSLFTIYHDNIVLKLFDIKDIEERQKFQEKAFSEIPNTELNRNSSFSLHFDKKEHMELLHKLEFKRFPDFKQLICRNVQENTVNFSRFIGTCFPHEVGCFSISCQRMDVNRQDIQQHLQVIRNSVKQSLSIAGECVFLSYQVYL